MPLRVASAFLFVVTLTGGALAGPTKSECVDANTRGQALRRDGQLHAAREALQTCIQASCPRIVQSDCQSRLDDITHAIPSFVIHSSEAPEKLAATSVTLDGEPLANAFDRPVEVDPGEHHLVFRAAGHEPVMRLVTVDEGVRERPVEMAFPEVPAAPKTDNKTFRVAGVALTASGLAVLALGSGLGLASYSAWGSVKSECLQTSPCDYAKASSDRSTALGFATGSDIAFGVGGALLVTGIVLFVLGVRTIPSMRLRGAALSFEVF